MYISEELRTEIDFFRRTNEHFEIQAGKSTCQVSVASDDMLYMAMSASLVMDYSEDGFFESFIITDKAISGKNELQIDAYAFIETDSTQVKQLHIFQYKLYENQDKVASPVELLNFATFVNNNFVHPELLETPSTNPVVQEIKALFDEFLNGRRGRRIQVFCHYINNTRGIVKSNELQINDVVMGRFLHDRQLFGFSIQVNGANDIIDLATIGKIRVDKETVEVVIDNANNSYRLEDNSKKSGLGLPKRVIVCMCNVNEFVRLQNKYHHNQLYTENIRLYLGDRGSVNKDIINTITSNDSIWFPYMNNGISIICDELTIGTVNTTKNVLPLSLKNMQIINGCQTINALYSAKYNQNTKDNFRAANVMVRIYEIDPAQTDFKMSIIKATNNQNAVKSYSLMANDPIQIEIARILNLFDVVYDRKGESKQNTNNNRTIISMTTAALAHRAVYQFKARSLRSGLGKSRVFTKGEYEKVFDSVLLDNENEEELAGRCCEILIASVILDSIRDFIPRYTEEYQKRLPIIRKSAYYLSGFLYAMKKYSFDELRTNMLSDYNSGNLSKLRGKDYPKTIENMVGDVFEEVLIEFEKFYKGVHKIEKSDIDNLLKDKDFEEEYIAKINSFIKASQK